MTGTMEVAKAVCSVAQLILSTAQKIYDLHEKAKCNKKMCTRLTDRVELLMSIVKNIQTEKHASEDLCQALARLKKTMENIESWIEKYTCCRWWLKVWRIHKFYEDFDQYNGCLRDSVQDLHFLIDVKHNQMFEDAFDDWKCRGKNERAVEAALQELKGLLQETNNTVSDVVDSTCAGVRQMEGLAQTIAATFEDFIKKSEDDKMLAAHKIKVLSQGLVKGEKLMETHNYILFKGQYHMAPVAIKCFKDPLMYSAREVKARFKREITVMNTFNYANIVRMYGICIDNPGPKPSLSIVMEYCEKGTLRELLKREPELSLEIRIDMCLGAARAVYRLHHTESKPVVHHNIDSTKFMVTACYGVKLTGFEFSQTESSVERNPNNDKLDNPLAFCSPERLNDINCTYDNPCDIYSLGIVMWEIVTGEIPLKDFTTDEIYQKICKENFQQPLPDGCPTELRDVINQCRAYEPAQRPCARVVADTLAAFVDRM